MTYLEAAHQILTQAQQPLHYREITERALDQGLIHPSGRTPDATMGSRLYVETKEESSAFVRAKEGRGYFGLAAWQPTGIDRQVQRINHETREELRHLLHKMPADRFEALIGTLLIEMGFDENTVQVTHYRGDKGIDVTGVLRAAGLTEVDTAVQVKRWQSNVGAKYVRELRGSLRVHQQGVIITTSDFSAGAYEEATAPGKTRIGLINGEDLLELLLHHRVGVQEKTLTVVTIDEEWWSEALGTDLAIDDDPETAPPDTPAPSPTDSEEEASRSQRTKPTAFVLFEQHHPVQHWRDILIQTLAILAQRHPDTFAATAATVRGRTRQYVDSRPDRMISPASIPGTELYVETNLSSKDILRLVETFLALFGYDSRRDFSLAE